MAPKFTGVLVFDENRFACGELYCLLVAERSGLTFHNPETVDEAVDVLKRGGIEIALVNPDLPGNKGGGIDFIRAHAPDFCETRFFLHCQQNYNEDIGKRLKEVGAVGYIRKGYTSSRQYLSAFGFTEAETNKIFGEFGPVVIFNRG